MAALLTMFGAVLPMSAQTQERQDALYIFRNDNKFNGFFFADIDRFEYSKVDTFGVEHDEFVVQEIYALDSVFRIPLNAIDSVAFVIPETKYRPGVITPESDLWSYVISSDTTTTFTLSASTPQALIPKVGAKLANTKASPYLPHGFYGEVASVTSGNGGTVVKCDKPKLEELFERYIGKFAGYAGEREATARSLGSRRADNYNATEEKIPFEPFEKKLYFGTMGWSLDDFKGDATLSLTFTPSLIVRAFFEMDWENGTFLDIVTRLEGTTDFELDIQAEISKSFDIGAPKLKFPLGTTPIVLEAEAGLTAGIAGEIKMNQKWHNVLSGYGAVQWIKGLKTDVTGSVHVVENSYDMSLMGKLTLNAGIYAQLMFALIDSDLLGVGVRFETGNRAELDLPLSLTSIALLADPNLKLIDTPEYYKLLNKDFAFKQGPYGKGVINLTALKGVVGTDLYQFFDRMKDDSGSSYYWEFEGGIVPKFTDVKWVPDKKRGWMGKVVTSLDRRLNIPMVVGQALYNKLMMTYYSQKIYEKSYKSPEDFKSYEITYEDLQPGKNYRVYPYMIFARDLLADQFVDFTLGPPAITFKPGSKVEVPETTGSKQFEVHTNMYNTEMVDPEGASWLMTSYIKDDGDLKIYYEELPEDVDMRRASIHFIGRDSLNNEILKEDSLVVTQIRPVIHADPTFLEFDAKGGTKTVKLTTPLNELWAELGDDKVKYLTFKLDTLKMTLDVTVEESKEKDERSTAILIHGYSPNGQRGNLQLNIFQAGIGGDDPDPGTNPDVLTTDTLYFDGDGGSVDVVYHAKDNTFDPTDYTPSRIALKDASDPMNPIYTITIGESWKSREDSVLLQEPLSPWHIDIGDVRKVYKKWIIKQSGKTKKKFEGEFRSCGNSFAEKLKNEIHIYIDNTNKEKTLDIKQNFSTTNEGEKVIIKYEWEHDNPRLEEDKYRSLRYFTGGNSDYKAKASIEFTLAQDYDGYYIESGKLKLHNHGYSSDIVGSERHGSGKNEYTTNLYAEYLFEGEVSLVTGGAGKIRVDVFSATDVIQERLDFPDDGYSENIFKWNGTITSKYYSDNKFVEDYTGVTSAHITLMNCKRVE
jgi:hypothetical protein